MLVLLSAVGTRGDVQPPLALALALRARGVAVRVCVPPNLVPWAASLGLEARPLGIAMRPPAAGAAPPSAEQARKLGDDLIRDQFDVVEQAADGCDAVVASGAHQYAARSVAEARGIPCASAVYAPISLPSPDLGPGGETGGDVPARWAEARAAWNARALDRVNAGRARLGLAPVDDVIAHILGPRTWLAADRTLGPAPSSPERAIAQAGAWLLPGEGALPAEVEAFLAAGDAPVYFGLGSMPAAPVAGQPIVAAARALGLRVIVSRGWAELALPDAGDDCLAVGDLDHGALFPRVAAVVHHGGAGTTHAAALAGAPQVLLPMFGDQFYWAERVRALGVGAGVPLRVATVDAVAAALRTSLEARGAARALAPRIVTDGAAATADALLREWEAARG